MKMDLCEATSRANLFGVATHTETPRNVSLIRESARSTPRFFQ